MSAKLSLFALALVCLAVFVQAQALITVEVFNTRDCTGTALSTNSYNSTTCYAVPAVADERASAAAAVAATSYISYSINADGSFAYSTLASDSACTKVDSVTEYKAECVPMKGSTTMATKYTVTNAAAGPATTFPPAGYTTTTMCFGKTSGTASTTCAASADVYCYRTSSAINVCSAVKIGDYQIGSKKTQCSPDGKLAGSVAYLDNACAGTIAQASLQSTECRDGSFTTCPSNVATLPSNLPSQAELFYGNNQCSDSGFLGANLYAANQCFYSETFNCATVNATQQVIYTKYTDVENKGRCTAGTESSTDYRSVDSCYQQTLGESVKYTCSYSPIINSAASVSVSAVAMLVAAVVALFAGRQL